MTRAPDDAVAALATFLRDELGVAEPLTDDTVLVSEGRIDSVALVRVAAFLERTTGIEIADRDLIVDHFDTLGRIRTYLRRRVGG